MAPLRLDPSRNLVSRRRWLFFGLSIATVAVIAWRAWLLIRINGVAPLEVAIFALFVILLTPLSLSFWTAVIGFLVQMRGGDALDLARGLGADASDDFPLTAIVMPVYNEDPARVFAGLKATYRNLEETGRLEHFEFFILSDTTDPDVWVREEIAFADLRRQVSRPERIFYRNRRQNLEKKTGNIADFCANWGGRYRYMIVFDADSIMSGGSLLNLVRLMEQNPKVGIIQAPPLPVNRQSLFGRVHQFAMHVYSRIFISGLNYWQGGAGNYWGHNAIIRIEPFVEHCRLPVLPGKPPLGGSILSHDFVEAAFMRRAGWRVYLASELTGSYEEMPASLIGYAARDRRWCQGNLQHGKLLFTPGLHFVSRVHIWLGIMGYLAAPLWLLMLVLATVQGAYEHLVPHRYFTDKALFPTWQISAATEAITLFLLIMGFLLLPKLLSFFLYARRKELAARFGSRVKLAGGVLMEMLLSTLLAPNMAWLQARFVISTLLGSTAKWEAQDRGDTGTTWSEAARLHWPATAAGAAWTVALAFTAPKLLPWFSPVILGLLLAIPLSVWTSRAKAGLWLRERGLFAIPEELDPPPVLQYLHEEEGAESRAWAERIDGLQKVLSDGDIRELHVSMLLPSSESEDPLKRHEREGIVLKYLHHGPSTISAKEKREVLLDREAITRLASEFGRERTVPA